MAGPFIGQIFLTTFDAGWTENYWLVGGDYVSSMSNLQNLCLARQALSLSDVIAINLRVSDATIKGDAYNAIPGTPNGTYVESGSTTVDPSLAVLFRFSDAAFLRRALHYIRGVPSTVIKDSPITYLNPPTPATWRFAVTAYKTAVIANAQLVHRAVEPPFTPSPIAVVSDERATIRKAGRPFGERVGRRVRA